MRRASYAPMWTRSLFWRGREEISILHGFEKANYDGMFADRMADLYAGLTEVCGDGLISEEVMTALALLYHKEIRELSAECFQPVDDYESVVSEFEKVKHLLQR